MRRINGLRVAGAILLVWALGAPVSQANDSAAELSIGGLTLTRNADISMESEELKISLDYVTVRYVFLNKSSKPVTLTVAFPLPDIDLSEATNYALPTEDPTNFVDFHTEIDGKQVSFDVNQRAFLGSKDVSETVRGVGLPLLTLGSERIAELPQPTRDRLLDAGLLVPSGSDERGNPLYDAAWTVKTSMVRQQTFPVGRPVSVEHRYRTSLGLSFDTVLRQGLRQNKAMELEVKRYVAEYCVADDLLKGIDKIAGPGEPNVAGLQERRISYVLKTGANWSGPIKDFHLVVDKGRPDRLVSFCAENVKKISPTAFEVRSQNFTPDRDLKILIISKN
jgi:hypothetical protein